ncbi:MAG: COX15/CtaA family protein [Rhodospirillaceae bacterium]|nr:COX15/CtaA family protein [Rhodospirillaceae bacterium]
MKTSFVRLARIGTLLALLVVVIGAWVRLTDAGLGCPDWPGCYGQLIVTESTREAAEAFPERPLDVGKAWREMIHRYLATGLGLLCLIMAGLAWANRRDPEQPTRLAYVLLALVIFQGLLGMWTVTLLLQPVIVMAHLLGGLATLGLLFWLGEWRRLLSSRGGLRPPEHAVRTASPGLARAGVTALLILVVQIALGGWTSANYAALACPDFPTCQTRWWPPVTDFREGFVLWRELGVDYEGGVLDNPSRVAIHFSHRLGAIAATAILGLLGWMMVRRPWLRPDGIAVLGALGIQLILGASIIIYSVPLAVAVAHNGVAALLLLTVLNANQRIGNHR